MKNSIKIENTAAKRRKVAKKATFQTNICQIVLVSFKILTQLPSSQPLLLGRRRCGTGKI
jgi:hypothetical protein